MQGTWGRRISGRVEKGMATTKFTLVLETREKKKVQQINYCSNSDLERYPDLYGTILDMMVDALDKSARPYEIP